MHQRFLTDIRKYSILIRVIVAFSNKPVKIIITLNSAEVNVN